MELAKENNTFISLHEEDPRSLNGILGFNEKIAKKEFLICGATGVAEYSMIARDVMIAYDTQAHVHIQHLSKAESVKVVEFAQKLERKLLPKWHLSISLKLKTSLLSKGANAKMNPPLRLESDRQAVIEGLKSGVIPVIATDHAPHHADEKNVDDVTKAPSGMTGLETSLSYWIDLLWLKRATCLTELLKVMTSNPSRSLWLDAGYLAEKWTS